MESIYSKLYDIAAQNCQEDHIAKKSIFEYYASSNPMETNISELMNIDASNEDFLNIAFIAIINRPVDDATFELWKPKFSMPQNDFRKSVINSIIISDEASISGKLYKDNTVTEYSGLKSFVKQPSVMLQLAGKTFRKMPEPVKNAVRKMRGIE